MSINIGDNFELMYPGDDGFIVDDVLVRGGYSIVTTLAERDAIPLSARKEGMVVYVQTPKLEYKLQDGVANTNWVVRNTMVDDGKTYARLSDSNFTGQLTYTQADTPSVAQITKFSEVYSNDSDFSFIGISLTDAEKAKIGMYTTIKGESSGAVAIISEVVTGGITVPSISSPKSKPEYRIGTFLQNERIIFSAGGVIARNDSQVVTLTALNAHTVSKFGGKIFGQLEIRPIYRYVSESTVVGIETIGSLDLALVKMNFTANDLQHVHGGMTIQVINSVDNSINDTITTVRLMTNGKGFVIKASDIPKIATGRKIKVMTSAIMPVQQNHAVCKEYVDGIVRPVIIPLKASAFSNFAQAFDPVKNAQRQLSRFIISKEMFSKDHLPIFKLYKNHTVDAYTYKYEINNPDIRVALRSLSATEYEMVVEFWDIPAYDCEIHVI